jgi:large subunit ribosomal protein L21e
MAKGKGKRIRQKGKLKLSRYFKILEEGASVAIVVDHGVRAAFPKRIQGKSGMVVGQRGKFNVVEIMDGNKLKTFIIHPIHLKRLTK